MKERGRAAVPNSIRKHREYTEGVIPAVRRFPSAAASLRREFTYDDQRVPRAMDTLRQIASTTTWPSRLVSDRFESFSFAAATTTTAAKVEAELHERGQIINQIIRRD